MDKIDQQYLNEIVGGSESGELDTQHDLKVHEENTTIEELEVLLSLPTISSRKNTPLVIYYHLLARLFKTVCQVHVLMSHINPSQ